MRAKGIKEETAFIFYAERSLEMNTKIVAVDFDGTLCENKYPDIGKPFIRMIDYVKSQKEKKNAKLILWTCRKGNELHEAIEWCKTYGLYFDSINKNLPEVIEYFGEDTRKIFANEYIDDRNSKVHSRNIFYLCDGKACYECSNNECKHTSRVEHALNFIEDGGYYFEKEEKLND